MARRQRVFVDTNELFPFTVMDALLTLAEEQLLTWVWTDELLEEWERVIVREHQRSAESARSVTDAVRAHFGRYRIPPEQYRGLVDVELSPDPDDRVHVAACLGGGVDVLLTRNTVDMPVARLVDAGVEVMTADAFLVRLLRRRPSAIIEAVELMRSRKRRPPRSMPELIEDLTRAGASTFATDLGRRIASRSRR